MLILRNGILATVLLGLSATGCHQPLAVANPLQDVSSWAEPMARAPVEGPVVRHTSGGLTVVGSRGDALNAATRLHQLLLRVRVPNQVVCDLKSASPQGLTQVRISFPAQLTPDQLRAVGKALADIGSAPRI